MRGRRTGKGRKGLEKMKYIVFRFLKSAVVKALRYRDGPQSHQTPHCPQKLSKPNLN